MFKGGLLFVLINIVLKLIVGFGLWKMAIFYKNSSKPQLVVEEMNPAYAEDPAVMRAGVPEQEQEQKGRIFPSAAPGKGKTQIRSDSYSNEEI